MPSAVGCGVDDGGIAPAPAGGSMIGVVDGFRLRKGVQPKGSVAVELESSRASVNLSRIFVGRSCS